MQWCLEGLNRAAPAPYTAPSPRPVPGNAPSLGRQASVCARAYIHRGSGLVVYSLDWARGFEIVKLWPVHVHARGGALGLGGGLLMGLLVEEALEEGNSSRRPSRGLASAVSRYPVYRGAWPGGSQPGDVEARSKRLEYEPSGAGRVSRDCTTPDR